MPLEEFTGYGMEKFQEDPQIAKLYSQAAGLTHFLVHYDGGRYRDALVAYLLAVYTGRDQPDTLAKLTGHKLRRPRQAVPRIPRSGAAEAAGAGCRAVNVCSSGFSRFQPGNSA